MRSIGVFFKHNFQRSKLMILLTIALGVLFCFILVSFSSGDLEHKPIQLYAIDNDKSSLSEDILSFLDNEAGADVFYGDDFDSASYGLVTRDYSAIIEIPENFETDSINAAAVQDIIITTSDNYENKAYLEAFVNSYIRAVNIIVQNSNNDSTLFHEMLDDLNSNSSQIEVTGADDNLRKTTREETGTTLTVGFFLNFSFIFGVIIAMLIYDDKTSGVLMRLRSTPAKALHYIIGIMAYIGLLGAVSIGILLAFIQIRGWHIGIPFGMLIYLLLVFMSIVISISIILALVIKTRIGILFSVYGMGCFAAMLGGSYFETDKAGATIQALSKLVPQHFVMTSIRSVQSDASYNYTSDMIILALFAILLVLIAAIVYNRQVVRKNN